jgi:hypothetical protein
MQRTVGPYKLTMTVDLTPPFERVGLLGQLELANRWSASHGNSSARPSAADHLLG